MTLVSVEILSTADRGGHGVSATGDMTCPGCSADAGPTSVIVSDFLLLAGILDIDGLRVVGSRASSLPQLQTESTASDPAKAKEEWLASTMLQCSTGMTFSRRFLSTTLFRLFSTSSCSYEDIPHFTFTKTCSHLLKSSSH